MRVPFPISVADTSAARRWAAVAAFAFCVICLWVYRVGPLPGERAALQWQMRQHWGPSVSALLIFFDGLGKPSVAGLLALAGAAVLWSVRGWRTAVLMLLMPAAAAVTDLLKSLLGPSPLWESSKGGENFPSGHAAVAAAAFGLLVVVVWSSRRAVPAAVLLGFAAAVGCAAVMAGAHLPSDVLAGYAVGGAWLALWLSTPLGRDLRASIYLTDVK